MYSKDHIQRDISSFMSSTTAYSVIEEAIFMNEYQIIELLLAYWPFQNVEIYRLLPLSSAVFHQQPDDEIDTIPKYLEKRLSDGSTLLDYIVMGLVNKHQQHSRLKIVDFHGCSTSKLSIEII